MKLSGKAAGVLHLQGCKAARLQVCLGIGDHNTSHNQNIWALNSPENARGARRRKPPSCGPRHVDRRRGPKAWEEAGEANSLGPKTSVSVFFCADDGIGGGMEQTQTFQANS